MRTKHSFDYGNHHEHERKGNEHGTTNSEDRYASETSWDTYHNIKNNQLAHMNDSTGNILIVAKTVRDIVSHVWREAQSRLIWPLDAKRTIFGRAWKYSDIWPNAGRAYLCSMLTIINLLK